MPWRLTSSKKTPWPSTSRRSSLRGTLWPTNPFWRVVASVVVSVGRHADAFPTATTASTMFQ